jgi:hypothetical protein
MTCSYFPYDFYSLGELDGPKRFLKYRQLTVMSNFTEVRSYFRKLPSPAKGVESLVFHNSGEWYLALMMTCSIISRSRH